MTLLSKQKMIMKMRLLSFLMMSKKQKRDKIVQTGCKAKMIVKVIDGRWEVIYFVSKHNHLLVDKPCLTKYLRSHQGIPPEERAFLTHLHNCNLTTGIEPHPPPPYLLTLRTWTCLLVVCFLAYQQVSVFA